MPPSELDKAIKTLRAHARRAAESAKNPPMLLDAHLEYPWKYRTLYSAFPKEYWTSMAEVYESAAMILEEKEWEDDSV